MGITSILDPNAQTDSRPRIEKQKQIKKNHKLLRLSLPWKNKAKERIKERLTFYESKGNENKASIYRLKLKSTNKFLRLNKN